MKIKSKLMLLALLVAPVAAHAALVSWQFGGVLNTVSGTASEISGVAAGDAFSVILTFDTAAPVTNPAGCGIPANPGGLGTTCRHNGVAAQLAFTSLQLGSKSFPAFGIDPSRNVVIVRNDAPDPSGSGVILDGYTWGGVDFDGVERQGLNLILRGPEDLGVVTDGRFLPALPPPGMLSWSTRTFEICVGGSTDGGANPSDCDIALLRGTVDRVSSVPEPATLALLGLAAAGLAVTRRRRRD